MTELGAISFGLFIIVAAVGGAAFLTWFERRLLGIWQDRYGPNRLGPFGAFQVLADMLKLLTKDDWVPPFADRLVFVFAPTAIVVAMLLGFAVVPFGPELYVLDINIGLLFFLGMTSLAVYSVLLGGLASNNKYALLGGLRSAAQMVSYEVFMGLSLMGVVMLTGSFSMRTIVLAQEDLWFCIPQFLGLITFMIAGIAESHRLPFDLPEAEHELTAGFHTEYGGMKFAMFMLGEYLVAGGHSAAALRPADVPRMEVHAAPDPVQPVTDRRRGAVDGGFKCLVPYCKPSPARYRRSGPFSNTVSPKPRRWSIRSRSPTWRPATGDASY
jgi:NADH-quinone oxidoreductase subunit H